MIRPVRTRVAAATGAAVLGLGWVAATAFPVQARPPSVGFSSPSAGAVMKDSTPLLAGSASMNEGVITELVITVSSPDGHPVPPAERSTPNDPSVTFSLSPLLKYNGRYAVTARVTGEDRPADMNGPETVTDTRAFSVEAPPARPSGVTASVDENRFVKVAWRANSEPDLLGYQVQRAVNDSQAWEGAGETGKTSTTFTDERTAKEPGDYRYRVVALRRGATANSGVASDPSAAASVHVNQGPPPTTTVNNNDGDGSTGSGSGSGSGTSGGTGSGTSGGSSGGTGSGSGTGSTSGSGSGSTSGSGGSSSGSYGSGPVITRSGKVDLSGFSTLLDQTRAPTVQDIPPPDEGFDETLPFSRANRGTTDQGEPLEEQAIGEELPRFDDRADLHRSLSFLAAGLLATVLLMHMLWLKGEVDRVPLEALPVDPADSAPRA